MRAATPSGAGHDARWAAALMCAAMLCYALHDAAIKAVAGRLPTGEVLALKTALATLLLLAPMLVTASREQAARGAHAQRRDHRGSCHGWITCRCIAEAAAGLLAVLALDRLPLADAAAIMLTAPLMISALAMALRWDPRSAPRLLAVCGGFVGALLVVRPGWTMPHAVGATWAAFGCAMAVALRDLATRRIPPRASSSQVALAASATAMATGMLFGVLSGEPWPTPSAGEWALLGAAAASAAVGSLALVVACRRAAPSDLAPWRYTFLVWAGLAGLLLWDDRPDVLAVAGMALIIVAGAVVASLSGASPAGR